MLDLKDCDLEGLKKLFLEMGEPAYRAKQVFQAIYAQGKIDFETISPLPKSLRQRLSEVAILSQLVPSQTLVSNDGTTKFLFTLKDGYCIESVLIPHNGYYTLCISTQVGCAQGCRFCLTGRLGLKRHLKTSEIINQVIWARSFLKRKHPWPLRNLVFMGMGEPLHNYQNVLRAIKILLDPLGLNFSHRRLTISTVGLVPQMLKMSQEVNISWAISLHAPDDDTRNLIVPVNKRYPLATLIEALKRMPLPPRKRFTIEYVMLKDINTSKDHALRLAYLLRNIPVKINLIPYNPHFSTEFKGAGLEFERPEEREILSFQQILQNKGYTVTIRKSKGADIGAACGQLDGK